MDNIDLADLMKFLENEEYLFRSAWLDPKLDFAVDATRGEVSVNLPAIFARIAIAAYLTDHQQTFGRTIDVGSIAERTNAIMKLLDERTAKALAWAVIDSITKPKEGGPQ